MQREEAASIYLAFEFPNVLNFCDIYACYIKEKETLLLLYFCSFVFVIVYWENGNVLFFWIFKRAEVSVSMPAQKQK